MSKINTEIINIPIHYDVDSHVINLDVFIKAGKCIESITDVLSKEICAKNFEYRIVILPSEEGSFKQKIGVVLMSGLIGVLAEPIADGIVKGLTDQSISEWAEDGTRCLKECIISFIEKSDDDLRDIFEDDNIDIIPAVKAKNDFYLECQKDKEVKAIGYTLEDDFPIKRNMFMSRVRSGILEVKPPDEYKLYTLIIVAPIIIENSTAKWKFKIKGFENKIYSMRMGDADFYRDVLSGKYHLKESPKDAELDAWVRCYYETENSKYQEMEILQVFRINKTILAKLPDNVEFEKVYAQKDVNQLEMFKDL